MAPLIHFVMKWNGLEFFNSKKEGMTSKHNYMMNNE